jgi:hypothetical protein
MLQADMYISKRKEAKRGSYVQQVRKPDKKKEGKKLYTYITLYLRRKKEEFFSCMCRTFI